MIHAFNPEGKAWCGRRKVKRGDPATQYSTNPASPNALCPECRREVAALCRRLAP